MAAESFVGKSITFNGKTYLVCPEVELVEKYNWACNGCAFYVNGNDGGRCERPKGFLHACLSQLQTINICKPGFGVFTEIDITETLINYD